jgi:hypothetical protein
LASQAVPQKILQTLTPFFSIIIPAKNAEQWLDAAMQSVWEQTYTDFEVLLVNDGSTDGTLTLMEVWCRKSHKVVVIDGKGRGLGHARNAAAKVARGAFLAFLDADDSWFPNKLFTIYKHIQKNDVKWVYHTIAVGVDKEKTKIRRGFALRKVTDLSDKGLPITPSATVIQRELFLTYGGFSEDTRQVEDLGLWLQLLHGGFLPSFIYQPLTFYRLGSGVTHHIQDHLTKVCNSIANAEKHGWLTPGQAAALTKRKHYETARYLHKQGDFEKARWYYRKGTNGLKTWLLRISTFFCWRM